MAQDPSGVTPPSDGSVACDHGPLDKGDGYCLACDLIESRDFWRTARAEEISVEIARLTSENERLRADLLDVADFIEGNLPLEEAIARIEKRLPPKTA